MVKEKLCDVDDPTQPVVGCELDGIDDGDESVQHHRGLRRLTFLVKVNGHLALLTFVGIPLYQERSAAGAVDHSDHLASRKGKRKVPWRQIAQRRSTSAADLAELR